MSLYVLELSGTNLQKCKSCGSEIASGFKDIQIESHFCNKSCAVRFHSEEDFKSLIMHGRIFKATWGKKFSENSSESKDEL